MLTKLTKQLIDQTAHIATALVILLLPQLVFGGFVIAGFLIGFVREQGQHWVSNRAIAWKFWKWGPNSYWDILFWTVGGAAAQLLQNC